MKRLLLVALMLVLLVVMPVSAGPLTEPQAPADVTYQTLPFAQNWANTGLITANDNWTGVPGIVGYLGDYTTSSPTGVDPQTLLADYTAVAVDVIANQSNPDTLTNGGVAEFDGITDPAVAFQGSGTADAPYLLLYINTTGYTNIQISYNLRDIDGSTDNAIQPVALHYRLGTSGDFTNVAAGYVADATTGPSLATLVTAVNVALPAAVDNEAQVQLRIMTTNAVGSDEWVGIDDISVTGTPISAALAPSVTSTTPINGATNVITNTTVTINFSESVNLSASAVTLECPAETPVALTGLPANNVTSVILTPSTPLPRGTICTVTVVADQVSDVDVDDPPDNMAADYVFTFTTVPLDSAPSVTSTTPANGANYVAINATITIRFSELVNLTASAVTLECPAGTPVTFTGLPASSVTSATLTPSAPLPNGTTCTVSVIADQVSDVDTDDPPDNMTANYVFTFTTVAADICRQTFTHIYQIQGSGSTAAITGTVTTQGVVVGDYELPSGSGQIRGFYLQDPTGDSDIATSDGIFVYEGGVNNVVVGQEVRVIGTAGENQNQTQISSPTIVPCGTTGSITPVDVTLPVPAPVAGVPYLERFEGMLVRFPQTLYVTEHYQLGRFGQVVMTSSSDRLQQPTNVVAPGAPALAMQAANDLNRIIVDDNNNLQNPDPILFGRGGNTLSASNTLRGGDSAAGIVGVLVYDWAGNSASGNAYRVRPVSAMGGGVPSFQATNPRPAAPGAVGGRLRVASSNLLNYFNTFGVGACTNGVGGTATDCRGAENATEFDRQWPKIVASLVNTGGDIIGITEMENDGYDSTSAIRDLVTKLNNATAPDTYELIDADALTGQTNALGTDAIKVGFIYKPAQVIPVGTTAALNSTDFVNGGDTTARNRPALAQAFEEVRTGERFVIVVNHLKSKGSACDTADAGDGQGNCNVVRTNAANLMVSWLASNPTGTGDTDILIVGDLNSYAKEDPITAIKTGGYTNLLESMIGASTYSYAFDGQWGNLDHALASASLTSRVTGIAEWHINADEPSVLDYNTNFKSAGQLTSLYSADQYRATDHDPVVIGLLLRPWRTYMPLITK